jgi:transglutaminase-like putative cysteine protease
MASTHSSFSDLAPRRLSIGSFALLFLVVHAAACEAAAPARAEVVFRQTVAVALQGVEVGTLEAVDERTKEGVTLTRKASLEIARGATKARIRTVTVAKLAPDLAPLSFRYERTDAAGTHVIEGKVKGDVLDLGSTKLPLPPNATFSLALEHQTRLLLKDGLKDGLVVERPAVIEEMGAVVPMAVRVQKKGVGFLVTSKFQGIETVEEVDAQGRTIVARTPAVSMVVYPVGHAPADVAAPGASGGPDLLAISTWRVQPVDPPVSRVLYRLRVADAATFAVPEDARQKVVARRAGSANAAVEAGSAAGAGTIDVEVRAGPSSTASLSPSRRAELLASTPYETVDDPRIQKVAADVTRGAQSKKDEIARLNRWVFDWVEKKGLDRGYAPATATLESKTGDCTEHSVLLSALLRARGIPTRLVDGVVVDHDRAGYHEWVEAFIDGEGFVAADPTFGQFPAGPERLKLAEGSTAPNEHLQLSLAAARLLGSKVVLEVVSSTPDQ